MLASLVPLVPHLQSQGMQCEPLSGVQVGPTDREALQNQGGGGFLRVLPPAQGRFEL